ncbi:hypothetical protein AAK964_05020 [Tissierella praeacuta]|uniref:hypothetical protein n=1 Tax=Tissierella praeacuta TaxID=43131 RepID=UPI003516EB97
MKKEKKKYVTIFTAGLARQLLKKGYMIADIKPHRENEDASIFVFFNEDGLMQDVYRLKNND